MGLLKYDIFCIAEESYGINDRLISHIESIDKKIIQLSRKYDVVIMDHFTSKECSVHTLEAISHQTILCVICTDNSSTVCNKESSSYFGNVRFIDNPINALTRIDSNTNSVIILGSLYCIDWYIRHVPWLCNKISMCTIEGHNADDTYQMLSTHTIRFISEECKKVKEKHMLDASTLIKYCIHVLVLKSRKLDGKASNRFHPEEKYLQLMKDVLSNGNKNRSNRTGISTLSKFGGSIDFDLDGNRIPLLLTKRVGFKTVLIELLWFLSGLTCTDILKKHNVHIWDGNTSQEFLIKEGKTHIPIDDIGEGYGHQWRHFGVKKEFAIGECYNNTKRGENGGYDQITNMINLLRTDPFSRRIILSGWNPESFPDCVLPPCHVLFQLYVRPVEEEYTNEREHIIKYKLDGQLYQRSCDLFLGVPFNLASYSILIHIFARLGSTDKIALEPGKLFYTYGDAHIYENHIDQVKKQLDRRPDHPFPKLSLDDSFTHLDDLFIRTNDANNQIEDFNLNLFKLHEYFPQSSIRAPMAV